MNKSFSGNDQTVRIWNYENGAIELLQKFHTKFQSLDLHPSGLFAVIGFIDQLRLVAILLGDLKVMSNYLCSPKIISHSYSYR